MARVRLATDRVKSLNRTAVEAALKAAAAYHTESDFYAIVGMRNPSRSYFIDYNSRRHSLKAVVAYALQRDDPKTLARDFHAADAAEKLQSLHFDVVHSKSRA